MLFATILHFRDMKKILIFLMPAFRALAQEKQKEFLGESVRGKDLYLMVDVCNYSITYSLAGKTNHMSPDDHFQNLKRIIAAIGGKGRRINVIMPFFI